MILSKLYPKAFLIIFVTGIFLLQSACTQKKKVTGNEFIDRDLLIEVISEMYLIDGITNDMKYYRKFITGDSIDIYSSIFEKHSITRKDYELTLDEYSKYPHLLDDVYDEVLMQLSILQEKVENDNLDKNTLDLKPTKHKQ